MTDLYTDERRDRIKKTMPDVWADAVHRVWNLSPNSPDVDWDNALWRIDKLTSLPAGAHEMDPIRSMWLFAAMYMVEKHAGPVPPQATIRGRVPPHRRPHLRRVGESRPRTAVRTQQA